MAHEMASSEEWQSLRAKIFAAPWQDWAHAYGPADDVPPLLEALATGGREEREQAAHQLYGNVFHQGTRWHASPRAVPFLLEMLALSAPPLPDRAWLIEYLVALALGYEGQFLPRGIDPEVEFAHADEQDEADNEVQGAEGEDAQDDEDDEGYEEEPLSGPEFMRFAAFARDSYREVERGCDLFLSLLDAAEPGVRLASAYALAWFPARAEETSRALLALWDAMGEPEQANALVVASLLGPRVGEGDRARWLARADATLDLGGDAARFGAAVALSNASAASGRDCDLRALQVLAGVARGGLDEWQQAQAERGTGLAWNSGGLAALAAACLAGVPEPSRSRAMAALQQVLPSAAERATPAVSGALLALAFPLDEDGERPAIERRDLSDEQLSVLGIIAEHGSWRVGGIPSGGYEELVRSFGLPDSQDGLRAWLAQK